MLDLSRRDKSMELFVRPGAISVLVNGGADFSRCFLEDRIPVCDLGISPAVMHARACMWLKFSRGTLARGPFAIAAPSI